MTDEIVTRYGRAMRLVEITPELAREWLATLTPGRRFDANKIARYSAAMRDGTWQLLQMPIVLRYGRLKSSWHRLMAVIEADMTVPMYVSDERYCPR